MTTGWLLLLLVVSSQSVDSQSTTGDEVCDGQQLREFKEDIKTLLDKQLQTIMTDIAAMRNGMKKDMEDILQQHENQTAMSRLGKL